MLKQQEADALITMDKRFANAGIIDFPSVGDKAVFDLVSLDEREKFLADVNRASIRLTKCTYQERYQVVEILVRLDVDGRPHENPDGEVLPCPHLHVYREGFADKWAKPLPADRFRDTSDLVQTFTDFLTFCHVQKAPEIQRSLP